MSCNFGLKSYLWFQIDLALRTRSILKSRVWFQTKLHSTQFNYHYKTFLVSSKKYLNRVWLQIKIDGFVNSAKVKQSTLLRSLTSQQAAISLKYGLPLLQSRCGLTPFIKYINESLKSLYLSSFRWQAKKQLIIQYISFPIITVVLVFLMARSTYFRKAS